MKKNRIILITGLSGAGKTSAMRVLEDMGYHCIDQYPVELLDHLYHLIETSSDVRYKNIALATTVQDFEYFIRRFRGEQFEVQVLLLEASDDVLLSRYKQSRKIHPLVLSEQAKTLEDAIDIEYQLYSTIKDLAYLVIDTSFIRSGELKRKLNEYFSLKDAPVFSISFISFGYKKGLPSDADLAIDVRFLPNPFWIAELRDHTGLEDDVYQYVMNQDATKEFLPRLTTFLDYLIYEFSKEGKNHFTICIGCTGGQHRSVSIVRYLHDFYKEKYQCYVSHRDIEARDEK